MNTITQMIRILIGHVAGLLCMAFGLVAAWSLIAIFLPYWDFLQRGLWLGTGLIFSLLSYLLYQRLASLIH